MAMALARTPPSATHDLPARRFARPAEPLRLFRGGVIEQPVLAYECWGRLTEARDNTILIFTGLSPSAHAASSRHVIGQHLLDLVSGDPPVTVER